jgi:hypothetical protein
MEGIVSRIRKEGAKLLTGGEKEKLRQMKC